MKSTRAQAGVVYLVGAGPGDPELLTVRALRLLQSADVVFHDDLVSPEVLDEIGDRAERISVGKRCGRARVTQREIQELMIAAARVGKAVVRLKSGDPLIFGRAGEEIAALRRAAVKFDIVPGVTAALAAGAALALPLTDREHASQLVFLTGHHAAEKEAGARLWHGQLPEGATVVVYMPGRNLQRLVEELAGAGMARDVPCVAVSHVATQRQTHVTSLLGGLASATVGPAPLLVIAGPAVGALMRDVQSLSERVRALQLV